MNRFLACITACLTALFLTGCIENAVLVELNPDGTGTMTVRTLGSPEISQNGDMDFMAGMKSDLENAEKYGEGVSLLSVTETSNKSGWKGYMAKYAFEDITKVTLQANEMEQEDENGGSTSMDMENDINYRFDFTPGPPAVLKLVPLVDGEEPSADGVVSGAQDEEDPFAMAGLEESDAGPGMAGMADGMATAMMASMAPMMKGMRISYLVKVNGEILETNAEHQPRENTVLVMDMKVDKLLSDAEAMAQMESGIEGLSQLAATNHPGLTIQDPSEPLVITFQ